MTTKPTGSTGPEHVPFSSSNKESTSTEKKTNDLAVIILTRGRVQGLTEKDQHAIIKKAIDPTLKEGILSSILDKFIKIRLQLSEIMQSMENAFNSLTGKEENIPRISLDEAKSCLERALAREHQIPEEIAFLKKFILRSCKNEIMMQENNAKLSDYADPTWRKQTITKLNNMMRFCDEYSPELETLKNEIENMKMDLIQPWYNKAREAIKDKYNDLKQQAKQDYQDVRVEIASLLSKLQTCSPQEASQLQQSIDELQALANTKESEIPVAQQELDERCSIELNDLGEKIHAEFNTR